MPEELSREPIQVSQGSDEEVTDRGVTDNKRTTFSGGSRWCASVAQMVEQRFRKPQVGGSNPFAGCISISQFQARQAPHQ